MDFSTPFAQVEKIAKASKARRMLYAPGKYLYAILYAKTFCRFLGLSNVKKVDTFFSRSMYIPFPAGTDVYLAGGKTDDAELRLTRFLFNQLSPGDRFIDIGAHVGYYSLLASLCIGAEGKVIAIEPSKQIYALLRSNAKPYPNITTINGVVSDQEGTIPFYEFPHLYSEYSSVYAEQFRRQKWFQRLQPQATNVQATTLDLLFPQADGKRFVKIDAEGSEYDILKGATNFLRQPNTTIIMEYLAEHRGNDNHKKAVKLLFDNGYRCFLIDTNGAPESCEDIDRYISVNKMESDNFVFIYPQSQKGI